MFRLYIGDKMQSLDLMPVAPKAMDISIGSRNKTYDLVNGGQVNLLKEPALSEISLELYLPNTLYHFAEYQNGFKPAKYFLSKFENYMQNKVPLHLILLRSENDIDDTALIVSLEEMTQKEDVTEYGMDIVANLKFKEYINPVTKISKSVQTSDGKKQSYIKKSDRTNSRKVPATTKIDNDILLLDYVKKTYGDTKKFDEIMKLNKFTNPNKKLTKGMVIKLVKT